jgi:hypothetical protein
MINKYNDGSINDALEVLQAIKDEIDVKTGSNPSRMT